MNNLLKDPIFSIVTPSGIEHVHLPGLLAALGKDEVVSFHAVRRHQRDVFHVFLCQLAAAGLSRGGMTTPVQTESTWRELLLELSDGNGDAWLLCVDDVTQPAFMQSPAPTQAAFNAAYTSKVHHPDQIDTLITAKNHDVKAARGQPDAIEMWLYALLTLQTTANFVGRGNYPISRMNGGFASRAIVSLVTDFHPSARFREECSVLLATRRELLDLPLGYKEDGIVLTWLRTWDRKSCIPASELDPFFIETARALRLHRRGEDLFCYRAASKTTHISGIANGDSGDLWTVLSVADESKALTVSSGGFTPKLLSEILFEQGYRLTSLQRPRNGGNDASMYLTATVLVRGQGTTEGFHEVTLPVPAHVRRSLFGSVETKENLWTTAKTLLNDAGLMERNALTPALKKLASEANDAYEWINKVTQDFSMYWQSEYFPMLWRAADNDASYDEIRTIWIQRMADKVVLLLREAETRIPIPASRRLRITVQAQSMLSAMLRKYFADYLKRAV